MRTKPSSCDGCSCQAHGTDFSAVEGTGSSGVMLVGEASGECEARDGLPFRPYAPAGSVLERTFRRMGLDRAQFSIANMLRCRPRNNWLENAPWEYGAINHCRPNLDAAIAERRPRAIVALGGIATRELTGMSGKAQGVTHLAGYVVAGPLLVSEKFVQRVPTIPNFHPSYLRRGKASHQGVFARILQRAVNIAKGVDTAWMWNIDPEVDYGRLGYITRPTVEDARSFASRVAGSSRAVLSYDIETFESTSLDEDAREGFGDTELQTIQFSLEGGLSISLPWDGPFKGIAAGILQSPNTKCGHNVWLFDNKVLRVAGEREGLRLVPQGVIHDTLAMFHHWQPDLPAHLQFAASFVQFPFPWKHLAGSHIAFYGCCDVDATLRLYSMLVSTMKRDGIWGDERIGYVGQVYEVRPILAAMEDRGMPIDDAARVALGDEFERVQKELGDDLHSQVPNEVLSVSPKGGYKRTPKNLTGLTLRTFQDADVDTEGNPVVVCAERYCRCEPFNPNSREQVIRYMKAKGHPVPKDKHRENDEGENPETTAAKELMRLAARTGDLFYLKVIDYRGMTKLRGTYVDGFTPGPDGCVHTTFTFDTGIGQLSSRNPNIQNFPKLKPTPALATAMRAMVCAKPGRVITEWDFKSCHIITLGFLAEDLEYMRLGRLDMHSFVAGHFLGLWDGKHIARVESDDDLRARFKWLKSDPERKRVRDDQAKHGILGIGNGLKAKGLYERYMESFPPTACPMCKGTPGRVAGVRKLRKCGDCKGTGYVSGARVAEQVLEACESLFPKVFAWQKRIQKLAHEQQYLRTQFGHIRRFYEVFKWDAKRHEMGHGDQAEEAIAFWLANIAFGHIREKLKQLAAAGLDEKYGLFNNVHDSFMFHFDESLLAEHAREVYPVLTSPSEILRHPTICPGGLVIDVEGAWGHDWANMTEIDTKEHHETNTTIITDTAGAGAACLRSTENPSRIAERV